MSRADDRAAHRYGLGLVLMSALSFCAGAAFAVATLAMLGAAQ